MEDYFEKCEVSLGWVQWYPPISSDIIGSSYLLTILGLIIL